MLKKINLLLTKSDKKDILKVKLIDQYQILKNFKLWVGRLVSACERASKEP